MGHCLVLYDITHDRTRTKVAEICLDYGLDRIQYSAFLGTLVRTHQEELMQKLERQLGAHGGNIQLYPICRTDWQARRVIEVKEKESNDQAKINPNTGVLAAADIVIEGGDEDEERLPF